MALQGTSSAYQFVRDLFTSLPVELQHQVRAYVSTLPGLISDHGPQIVKYIQDLKKQSGPDMALQGTSSAYQFVNILLLRDGGWTYVNCF